MHISSFERAKREAGGPQVQIANAMGNPDNDFTIGINACNATTNQIAVVDMFANAWVDANSNNDRYKKRCSGGQTEEVERKKQLATYI